MSRNDFRTLLSQVCRIQVEINKEQRRPRPDWQRLSLLKKYRLAMQDKIALQAVAAAVEDMNDKPSFTTRTLH